MSEAVFSLIGSCVTRDASDLGANPLPRPVSYHSRTRIQSIVSAPTGLDPEQVSLRSGFQRRVVLEDHDKRARRTLRALVHPVVIDLIDERLPLLRSGSGLVTGSPYLYAAGLARAGGYTRAANDDELDPSGPFGRAVGQLASLIPPHELVVVHRAYWATRSTDGRALENEAEALKQNTWLRAAYQLLEESLAGRCAVVEVSEHLRTADPEHRWGLAPYHYAAEYYDELADRVREVLQDTTSSRGTVVSSSSLKKVGA